MKTFYKVTIKHKITKNFSQRISFLFRPECGQDVIDDVVRAYTDIFDRKWKVKGTVKQELKTYKRVPQKFLAV